MVTWPQKRHKKSMYKKESGKVQW